MWLLLQILVTMVMIADAMEKHRGGESECRGEIPPHIVEKRLQRSFHPGLVKLKVIPKQQACPDWSHKLLSSSNIEDRSTSPWTYRVNTDPNRIPEEILEAVCLCPGCIDMKGLKHTQDFSSVPVTKQMLVYTLHRCANNMFKYQKQWIYVSVACTCVAPQSR
ncbi:interleukin-17C-like [Latimeria chalumnae]|uniref:interleukin-17C-like n=1 Tax=Latimeria chalumnae TaxID=7897 RepID=UPI0003C1947F|nr:PREDICTED: interleukin-17C-like [Latimeria chalumnae]|eukprot:XP_006008898.1 PREDICTED: interleukin-17C-like [Latimeria chalumnae]